MAELTLAQQRANTVGAAKTLYFMDTAQTATIDAESKSVTGGSFSMMNVLGENSSVNIDVTEEELPDVTQDNAVSQPTSGKMSQTPTQMYLPGNPVCDKLEEIYRAMDFSGKAISFTIIELDLWGDEPVAYANTANVTVTGVTNEAQGLRKFETSINYQSKWLKLETAPTFNETNGTLSFG